MRFCGAGGQGILLVAYIAGLAAVADGRNVVQSQSYGSESRGGQCRSDVNVQDEEICELELESVDLMVALSQRAHDANVAQLHPGGVLVIDSDLVVPRLGMGSVHAVPFTDAAQKAFDSKVMGNMVLLGYLESAFGLASDAAMRDAISKSVPGGTEAQNIKAYEMGLELGREHAH